MAQYLESSTLVAGAAATGHGVLTGWHGRRDMMREDLSAIAIQANIPKDWLPSVKDAAVQLGRAVQHVAGSNYLAKPTKKRKTLDEDAQITWDAQWSLVVRPTSSDPVRAGDAFGTVALVVTLYTGEAGPRLVFERNQADERTLSLPQAVESQFEARISQQRYTAADITKWLGDTLRRKLGSIRYGGNWYIPRETKDVAQALLNATRESGWGTNWMYPALPVATSPELSQGLSIEFANEVNDVMAQLQLQRNAAIENGRKDIGPRAVTTYQARFQEVYDRIKDYETRGLVEEYHAKMSYEVVAEAMVLLDTIRETFPVENPGAVIAGQPELGEEDFDRFMVS